MFGLLRRKPLGPWPAGATSCLATGPSVASPLASSSKLSSLLDSDAGCFERGGRFLGAMTTGGLGGGRSAVDEVEAEADEGRGQHGNICNDSSTHNLPPIARLIGGRSGCSESDSKDCGGAASRRREAARQGEMTPSSCPVVACFGAGTMADTPHIAKIPAVGIDKTSATFSVSQTANFRPDNVGKTPSLLAPALPRLGRAMFPGCSSSLSLALSLDLSVLKQSSLFSSAAS
mmetsp:Transcript_78346/g.226540  ORF Transcript_78346/g.226540 Transcript_78346/m.226540 type:complete len:232 (-) Transcript_78346:1031-1726(-)